MKAEAAKYFWMRKQKLQNDVVPGKGFEPLKAYAS